MSAAKEATHSMPSRYTLDKGARLSCRDFGSDRNEATRN
jgi:hypothetical protein